MSKSDFDKLSTLVLFSLAYVTVAYVVWHFITLPAVLHYGDTLSGKNAFSCTFDEVLANLLFANAVFALTKFGKKKEAK